MGGKNQLESYLEVQREEKPGWEHKWNLALGGNPGGIKARVQNGRKSKQDNAWSLAQREEHPGRIVCKAWHGGEHPGTITHGAWYRGNPLEE